MTTQAHFTDILAPHIQSGHIPGAVLAVADKDSLLAHEAHGVSNLATQTPMTLDSLFWIASMTKPLTATGFMMLVDEGKIDLDATVESYLPEFKNAWVILGGDDECQLKRKPKNPMRVRQLLSHTSGLPSLSPLENQKQDVLSLQANARLYAATALHSEPGTKYVYSNCGINTAGRLMELVSGIPYDTFMKTRLLDPLGMTNTTFVPTQEQAARIVPVYRSFHETQSLSIAENAYLTTPLTNPARQPFPGGGYFSCASDMAKFGQLILNKGLYKGQRLLQEDTLRRFTSQQPDPGADPNYGLGFALLRDGESLGLPHNDGVGHGGAYQTNLAIHPTSGVVTVWLIQLWDILADAVPTMASFRSTAVKKFGKTT